MWESEFIWESLLGIVVASGWGWEIEIVSFREMTNVGASDSAMLLLRTRTYTGRLGLYYGNVQFYAR